MTDVLKVQLPDRLRRFVERQIVPNGSYRSASDYVHDLIRHDYERKEDAKWDRLERELRPGIEADECAFEPFEVEEIIAEAKAAKIGATA